MRMYVKVRKDKPLATYTYPNGHWWKQKGGKGICICGEKGRK